MRTARELLPLAIGIAIAGVVTWLLLDGGWTLGPWLLAALLFGHGWVHLMFVFPRPDPVAGGPGWPFDLRRSWLVTRAGLDARLVRALGLVLMVVVFAGFTLAALCAVGILVPAAWWSGLVAGSSVASMILLGLCFSPTLLLGIAIDLALLWFALIPAWSPRG